MEIIQQTLIEKVAEKKSVGSEENIDKKADKMEAAPESEETQPKKNEAEDDIESIEPEK